MRFGGSGRGPNPLDPGDVGRHDVFSTARTSGSWPCTLRITSHATHARITAATTAMGMPIASPKFEFRDFDIGFHGSGVADSTRIVVRAEDAVEVLGVYDEPEVEA